MQIVMIHGQNHRGSTYHIGKMVADALGGTVTEFFLPRDFGSFCVGCNNCFMKDESLCPHHAKLKPITDAMDDADVLILTSPVYVYHATGAMKAFLDHYGYRWMVHRPEPAMFHKQAGQPLLLGRSESLPHREGSSRCILGPCFGNTAAQLCKTGRCHCKKDSPEKEGTSGTENKGIFPYPAHDTEKRQLERNGYPVLERKGLDAERSSLEVVFPLYKHRKEKTLNGSEKQFSVFVVRSKLRRHCLKCSSRLRSE